MPTKQEILDAIRSDAAAYNIDPDIAVRQCATESSFDPDAHNARTDCHGLFQLASFTAAEVKVDRYDWRDNIRGGMRYLAKMLKRFNGSYPHALAAYNWGPGNLRRCIRKWGDSWRDHLPAETKNYLTKILRRPLVKRGGGK